MKNRIQPENLDGFPGSAELSHHAEQARNDGAPKTYCDYGATKALAMQARINGEIGKALTLEQECDSLYKRIPARWRW